MRSSKHHLGIGFEVWSRQRTWFWCLVNPDRNGGTIGLAATEADAVREACLLIEKMSARRRADLAALRAAGRRASSSPWHQSTSLALAGEAVLANLEVYLARTCDAAV
jgi:hypothetical protein